MKLQPNWRKLTTGGEVLADCLPDRLRSRARHAPEQETDDGPDIADAMVVDLEPGRRCGCGKPKRLYERTSDTRHYRHNGQNRNPAAAPATAAGATRHFDTDFILRSAPPDRITEPVKMTGGCRRHHQFCVASENSRRAAHPASARGIA